jgi:cytochrome c peroxidase
MKRMVLIVGGVILTAAAIAYWAVTSQTSWSEAEVVTLKSLRIGSLSALPADPSNSYADDSKAAEFGQQLFFDTRFSSNGEVACATCHKPELMFTDGLPLAKGVGTTTRKSMTIIGTAYSPWLFWDGRKDSQWAQALGPLESAVEHGGTRAQHAHLIDEVYRAEYESIFGSLPDFSDRARFPDVAAPVDDEAARAAWDEMTQADRDAVTQVYVNMGKAIAAYERLIMPAPSRFDQYVEALLNNDKKAMQAALTDDEVAGLRLFIDRAQCIGCHNGPLFTNNEFHNTGVPSVQGLELDDGRASGVVKVLNDEFNCLSSWSDAGEKDCADLRFVTSEGAQLAGAFKPPTLRNVAETAPYMHAGQFGTLAEVIQHYNRAPRAPVGHSELEMIHLTQIEMSQLEAFLRALSGALLLPPELLQAPR